MNRQETNKSAKPKTTSQKILLAFEITLKTFAVLIIVAIIAFMAYNELVARKVAQRAEEIAQSVAPTKLEIMDEQAQIYNKELVTKHKGLVPHPATNNNWKTDSDYTTQLSYPNEEVMGAIHIPKIDVNLPIYHGTDDITLTKGVGHLYGTSIPIGVKDKKHSGQNATLTSHTGLPTALLFTRLDELRKNDMFALSILNKKLKYRIDKIEIVDPHQPKQYQKLLRAKIGEDRVTLITCTPFGINTHRLIVSGVRTEDELVPKQAVIPFPLWMAQLLIATSITATVFWIYKRRKQKHKKAQKENELHQNKTQK